MFKVTELYHFNVVCSDFEKSLEFYVDMLGGIPAFGYGAHRDRDRQTAVAIRRKPNAEAAKKKGLSGPSQSLWAMIRYGDYETATYVDLLHRITPPSKKIELRPDQIGVSRICFGVDNLDAAYEELKAKEVEFASPPAYSTLEDNEPDIYSCNCKDPDGLMVTLIQAPVPRWGVPPTR